MTASTRRLLGSLTILGALAVAACDGGGEAPERNVTRIKIANPHHDELAALSEPMRRLGLMRAIRDSGNRCRRVDGSAYQEDYRNMAMWVARCEDGRQWAVFIAPNANVQVRNCAHVEQLELPACRTVEAAPIDLLDPASNAADG